MHSDRRPMQSKFTSSCAIANVEVHIAKAISQLELTISSMRTVLEDSTPCRVSKHCQTVAD